ncbi:MAG: FHA domain-containing protein, partial [Chloroflexota bacterium]
LEPSSIAFRPEGSAELPFQPVITGLGLAYPLQPVSSGQSSLYLPPEYDRPERGRPDAAVDLYALGVILYELVTGQLPAHAPFPPARVLRADVPEALERLLLRAVHEHPAERYSDANQFAAALNAVLPRLTGLTGAPAGLREAASLAGVYQAGLDETQPGIPGGAAAMPAAPASMPSSRRTTGRLPGGTTVPLSSGDTLYLMTPDGQVQRHDLRGLRTTLGRGEENDIQIDRPGVSRRHAMLENDGAQYLVSDLNSTNGTFIETTRLVPNSPTAWPPGENLRIGDVWLRLERAAQAQTTQAFAQEANLPTRPGRGLPQTVAVFTTPDGSTIDSNLVQFSPDERLGVYIETPNLSVTPGSGVSLNILVLNRAPRPDVVSLVFEGLPPDWVSNPPRPLGLPANGQRQVQVTLRPPRTSAGRAGRHMFAVRAASQNDPSQVVETRLSLTVTAFSQFFSELQPKTLQSGQQGQVMIHNRGNLPEAFTVLFEDRFHELVFEPPEVRVTVPPGKAAAVEYRPALLKPRWFGSETISAYKVHVSAQTGQLLTHNGEYISRGLVPLWAPALLSFLCVVLACFLLVMVNQVTTPQRSTRSTADARQTQLAQGTLGAVAAVTQTAVGTQTAAAGQATLAAATATAAAAGADADSDGLSTAQETANGTRPDVADTDGDGLKDGEEVNLYKTLPLIADTDGDTLTDGSEVQLGINPLKPDTDGDGLPDNTDPLPLVPFTPTPLVIRTFTPVVVTPVNPIVDLASTITNNRSSSSPGDAVTYTILVTNRSANPAANAQASLSFPPGLSNVTWNCSASPGSRCLTPNGFGSINARMDLAPNGQAQFVVSALVVASPVNQLVVTFTASPAPGGRDANPIDNQATDVDGLPPRISLTLNMTDSRETIQPGQVNIYTIVVGNNGPSPAEGVTVVNNFPPQLQDIAWSCSPTPGSACLSANGVGGINTQVSLAAGGSATFTVNTRLRPDALPGLLSNTTSISAPVNPAQNNRTVTDTTLIEAPYVPPTTEGPYLPPPTTEGPYLPPPTTEAPP